MKFVFAVKRAEDLIAKAMEYIDQATEVTDDLDFEYYPLCEAKCNLADEANKLRKIIEARKDMETVE